MALRSFPSHEELEETALSIIENPFNAVGIIEGNRFTLVNALFAEIIGYHKEELAHITLDKLIVKEDFTRFQHTNDTLGHYIGNKLLVQVGERLRTCLGNQYFIARLGGDEFAVIVPEIKDQASIENKAKKIIQAFEEHFVMGEYEFHITTSIGISIYPDGGETSKELINNGEKALYNVKEQGKNNYQTYSPIMNVSTYKRYALENDLKQALQKNQLYVEYQPYIDLQSEKITCVEALIRWDHPEWGIVTPDEIIPLAEGLGIVNTIGEWMLHSVCQQLKEWDERLRKSIIISLNLSAFQFLQSDFVEKILQILNQYHIRPETIEFDISEKMLMRNEGVVGKTMKQLQAKGIRFAFDNFGTGYSSLNLLRKYGFNTLKVDRSLIRDFITDQKSRQITSSIIYFGKSLGVRVVAQGIEERGQLQILQENGCDKAQGYYLCKPVRSSEMNHLLKDETYSMQKKNVEEKAILLKIDGNSFGSNCRIRLKQR